MKTIYKIISLLFLISLSTVAQADSIRTSDGISCNNSNTTPYEISSFVNTNDERGVNYGHPVETDDVSVGVKFSYKFGGPDRLDCNKLYKLELRTKEAQVKQLEEKVKLLEIASSIDWE